jgi:hypothetical protein
MLCIHSEVPNKPGLIFDDLSASTSDAYDSELDSIIIKPVIVDTACLNNSCLNNCVMPKTKESGLRGKFVPTCHNYGKIGHIWPSCYLLKSHRPWIKQNAIWTSEVPPNLLRWTLKGAPKGMSNIERSYLNGKAVKVT